MADPAEARKRLFSNDATPLNNWVFYLDLPNYPNAKALQRKIENLGGRVEQFLSKEVRCVITNSDIKGTQPLRRSPRNKTSHVLTKRNQLMTRAEGMVQKAKQKQSGWQKTNVIAVAKGLGIDVKHVDDVITWLKRGESGSLKGKNEQTRILRGKAGEQRGKPNARQLKSPFLKVEDQSRLHQPLIKELEQWPSITFESQAPDCPFDPPRSSAARSKSGYKTSSSNKGQQFNGQTAKATGRNGSSQKAGYCEVCKANYRGLKQHLRGIKHKKNATNSAAYKELDETISEGKTVAEYFKSLEAAHASDIETAKARKTQTSTLDVGVQTPVKHVTPLKIIFSPRAGYAVVKTEAANKGRHPTEVENGIGDDIILKKSPKKRCVDEYSVVWMSELTMKIRRSTRILRGPGYDQQGSVYVDFPVFKEQPNRDPTAATTKSRANAEDSAVIKKYGDVQGKIRISTRVLDAENHKGLEEFECPMYVESSEQ